MTTITAVPRSLAPALDAVEAQAADWLARHSIDLLRISLGLVFFGFGVLKFFPGVSPAEGIASETFSILTFGLVPHGVAMALIAALETSIGLLLIAGRGLRLALALLAVQMVGILSPIVLLPGEMFRTDPIAPTLAGQYVLKDIILGAAVLVVAAKALGAELTVRDRS
ncbi:MAG: DoxX family membrane protein [Chloroflexota bacterium]